MEVEVITQFTPDLVTAISDNVLSVSDQCLAKGLITESTYKKVLESRGTSEDRARTLLLAVKRSTEIDSSCFKIVLYILEENLPYRVKQSLLKSIGKEYSERSRAVVPATAQNWQIPEKELSREHILHQTMLIGHLEDSVRQHTRACTEKDMLNEKIQEQRKEIEKLKEEVQNQARDNDSRITDTESRLSTCESEVLKMKERISELELIIEEQGMKVKRRRNTLLIGITEQERKIGRRLDNEHHVSLKSEGEEHKDLSQAENQNHDESKVPRNQEQGLSLEEKPTHQISHSIQLPANYIPMDDPIPPRKST